MNLLETAQSYIAAGLCVLPARRAEKRPAVGRWKHYRKRMPNEAELSAWFANRPDAVCILCGAASGNLEIIDFDAGGELFDAWSDKVRAAAPGLIEKLVIQSTQSGGRHAVYRCASPVCGSMKLAQRKDGEKIVTLIETRGEGGLFLCAPTPGYELIQGDLANPPVLTVAERDVLLHAAWELNEHLPPVVDGPMVSANVGHRCASSPDNSHSGDLSAENAHKCDCPSDNGHHAPMSADISHNGQLSADNSNIRSISADSSDNAACQSHNSHNSASASDNAHNPPLSPDNSHSSNCPSDNGVVGRTSRLSVGQCDCPPDNADRPGDDFNNRGDVRAVLEQFGWVRTKGGQNEYWRRPGKTSGTSATLKDRVFYVFSSNAAPFEPNRGYSPFAVYTLLHHGGDFEQAARCLRERGFGGDSLADSAAGADISAIVRMSAAPGACSPENSHSGNLSPENSHNGSLSAENSHNATYPSDNGDCGQSLADDSDNGPPIQRLKGLIDNFAGLNAPVIHGLLREGETMNIIASPKMGKSWFVSTLAISIASGLDWLGLAVEQGRVLHIDNELHACTSAYRYGVLSEAMGLPYHLYSNNIDMVSLRGQLRDLYSMGSLFGQVAPGQYKLVIIDAFYRTLPRDTDENDNGAIANLYNRIDHYAAQLECAFVLIHHSSKGNQSGKAVTDVGAGAGSQSRAADAHLILRPHEEEDVVVLESAVRSWPPMAPKALLWNWPLFTPTDEVDTSALLGAAKPKSKPRDIPLEDFVAQCVAINDPCSKRSVRYEAGQRFGLPERQAYEMLDLAIERGLVARIRTGSQMRYVKNRPGVSGDKALWTAALLAHDPDGNAQDIAEAVGVTRQYINQIRRSIAGNCLETGDRK
jgi:hypothetical protein